MIRKGRPGRAGSTPRGGAPRRGSCAVWAVLCFYWGEVPRAVVGDRLGLPTDRGQPGGLGQAGAKPVAYGSRLAAKGGNIFVFA